MIASLTCGNGVDWLFFTGPSAWMMCQPYCVFTGLEMPLSPIVKAVCSNSGTSWPFVAVIFPPWFFEAGSCGVLLRDRLPVAAGLELPVELVGMRLLS